MLHRILVLAVLSASTTVFADAIDVNLSSDVAQFEYIAPMGSVGQGRSALHVGLLYNDSSNTMGSVGVMVNDSYGSATEVALGVGVKAVVASVDSEDAMALTIGGQIRLTPLQDKAFGFVGQIYFAPAIATFGDAERYAEFGIRAEYEFMPQTAAYVGYRKIKFDAKAVGQDFTVDESVHVGVRVAF